MRSVSAMDISGLDALEELLGNVNEQPYHVMEKASFIDRVGADTLRIRRIKTFLPCSDKISP